MIESRDITNGNRILRFNFNWNSYGVKDEKRKWRMNWKRVVTKDGSEDQVDDRTWMFRDENEFYMKMKMNIELHKMKIELGYFKWYC